MATKLIEFVQFYNCTELRYEEFDFVYDKWYRVVEKSHDCYNHTEFYEEDEDGDEQEVEYDVISFYNDDKSDFDCIKNYGLKYKIIQIEVECDENDPDKINRLAA